MTTRALFCALPLLAACSIFRPHADPTQYFVLTSEARAPTGAPAPLVVGVERIDLPEYLMRPEIAMRTGSNQLKISDNDRWGEPLKDGFSRTLRTDLEAELGAGHVVAAPFDPAHRPSLLLDVEVRRFERVLPDQVVLEGTWVLRDGTSGSAAIAQPARVQATVSGGDTRATVAGLSTALAQLSGQIAQAVRLRTSKLQAQPQAATP